MVVDEVNDHKTKLHNPAGIPVLVIHGAKDLQSSNVAKMYVDTFQNVQFKIIKNTHHFPFVEQPTRTCSICG